MNGEIRIHLQRIPLTRDEVQVREIPIELLQARPNVVRPIFAQVCISSARALKSSLKPEISSKFIFFLPIRNK